MVHHWITLGGGLVLAAGIAAGATLVGSGQAVVAEPDLGDRLMSAQEQYEQKYHGPDARKAASADWELSKPDMGQERERPLVDVETEEKLRSRMDQVRRFRELQQSRHLSTAEVVEHMDQETAGIHAAAPGISPAGPGEAAAPVTPEQARNQYRQAMEEMLRDSLATAVSDTDESLIMEAVSLETTEGGAASSQSALAAQMQDVVAGDMMMYAGGGGGASASSAVSEAGEPSGEDSGMRSMGSAYVQESKVWEHERRTLEEKMGEQDEATETEEPVFTEPKLTLRQKNLIMKFVKQTERKLQKKKFGGKRI